MSKSMELLVLAMSGITVLMCFLAGAERERVITKKNLCSVAYKIQVESEKCMTQDVESIYIDIMTKLEE